jgi:hypothetical protein
MRRPTARKLRSKNVVLGQIQSSEFSIEHYRPLASLMLHSASGLDLVRHDNTVDKLTSFEIKSKDLKDKVDRQLWLLFYELLSGWEKYTLRKEGSKSDLCFENW